MSLEPHQIQALAQRFEKAGGKRISITEATARVVSQALEFYAMSLLLSFEEGKFFVYTWSAKGDLIETLARAAQFHVADAAFEEATRQRPRDIVTLQHGFRVIRRFEGGPRPAAPAQALAVDTKKAPKAAANDA